MKDKVFCASSYLMYRTMADPSKCFDERLPLNLYSGEDRTLIPVGSAEDLKHALASQMEEMTKDGKAVLALSGGIDSAILAKMMPAGSKAYTFQCIVPGMEVTSEVEQAARYAKECGLEHEVVKIYWEDFEKYASILMKHKGAPIHSIEVQIFKAATKAKDDGFRRIIFGESADLNYGGLSDLLSIDRTIGEFVDRYSYIPPYHVLKDYNLIIDPIAQYEKDGFVDTHEFCRDFFLREAMGSYTNACETAGIDLKTPYVHTWLSKPLDYRRIRSGENKYIVRELFKQLYPDFQINKKLPMPRATNEWFRDWQGPVRPEFLPNCYLHKTGDQKWMLYALERFFDMLEALN